MKAMVNEIYGAADVVRMAEVAMPVPGKSDVLVKVGAAGVTTGDWRLRAAAFPGVMAIPGRLMFGVCKPRNRVLGNDFAGTVVAAGEHVTAFKPGDRVFGSAQTGAHAEYLVMPEKGAIAALPARLSPAEGAALPFGGLTALAFLRDFARIEPGQRVAVIGASGRVGTYAVQIARALGAVVTGVASGRNEDLVRSLGAEDFVDYRKEDITRGTTRFDLVLDTVGALSFRQARRILKPRGVFAPLNFGLREVLQGLGMSLRGGQRVITRISGDAQSDLKVLAAMAARGQIRPIVQARFPMDRIADAYALVEGRHRSGAVILDVAPETAPRLAA